jgi:hypothetical protein
VKKGYKCGVLYLVSEVRKLQQLATATDVVMKGNGRGSNKK